MELLGEASAAAVDSLVPFSAARTVNHTLILVLEYVLKQNPNKIFKNSHLAAEEPEMYLFLE